MRILQLDVNSIEYELIKPESKVYEDSAKKIETVKNAIALLVTIENGDTNESASKAITDAVKFAKQQKSENIVIYPFAHLSDDLEEPAKALDILKHMRSLAKQSGINVVDAPFGWNKRLSIAIKGHPLAEQSHHYGSADTHALKKPARKLDISIVKKSDWSGLHERDHRTIGEQLDLYSFQEVSPAMVYWHPKGLTIYNELVKLMREKEEEYDYKEISTPLIANIALWQVSGHLDHYKADMFIFDSAFGEVGLKPMNCPSTILIYKSKRWSYRELPFRTAIFDKLHRSELSGVVTGLFRVKQMTQDDGHIFAREDQIGGEIAALLKMVKETYAVFGMKFVAKLSTMPDDHMGSEELWTRAEATLKSALSENSIDYEIKEKEGAFYGPKIDFDVYDSIGRPWQCATIQLDYQLPLNFGLEYTGEDGKQYTPVIIHRAILGSLERFTGVLVEHYGGKFPLWLSPIHARVISISEASNDYASNVYSKLKSAHIRAELDISDKTLDYKIREAQMQKIPYIVILGKKEKEKGLISIRTRDGIQMQGERVEDFASALKEKIANRTAGLELKK